MVSRNQGWARDFFGPLWAWLAMGGGLIVMTSAYGLSSMGFTQATVLATFLTGAGIVMTMLAFLAVLGRRSWQAWFWMFHKDDDDLIMGRKK